MKAHLRFLWIGIGLLLGLAACAPQAGVFEIQVVPAAQSTPAQADLDEIRPVALTFLSGISDDRRLFFSYQDTTCAPQAEAGDGPVCRAGEQAGSAVKVFPIGGTEHAFLRPEEIGQILDWSGESLYAVFRPTEGNQAQDYWPAGEFGLLFERSEAGNPSPFIAYVADGELVRLDVYPGLNPEEVLNELPLAGLVLTPSEAKAWSAPLKSLQVASQEFVREDMQWRMDSMIGLPQDGGDEYYTWMSVVNEDGSTRWQVVNEWVPFAMGYSIPLPLYWSTKSPVVYWTNTLTPDGCVVFSNASDLHSLDLTTGQSSRLLDKVGQWLAMSPDESQVAAVGRDGLSIYHLPSGEKQSTSLPAGQPGQIVWSPDNQTLVLTVADNPCSDPEQATYSVLRVDARTLKVETLIDHDLRRFATLQWSPVGSVLLADKNGDPWQMDPQTGEVWQETGPGSDQGAAGGSSAIFGWVSRADGGAAQDDLLEGVLVHLGAGACPSTGLAEAVTIKTDISFSFTSLPAGTYCVSIDPGDPANQPVLSDGEWVQPMHTAGMIQTTIVLAEGETRFNTDFSWRPAQP